MRVVRRTQRQQRRINVSFVCAVHFYQLEIQHMNVARIASTVHQSPKCDSIVLIHSSCAVHSIRQYVNLCAIKTDHELNAPVSSPVHCPYHCVFIASKRGDRQAGSSLLSERTMRRCHMLRFRSSVDAVTFAEAAPRTHTESDKRAEPNWERTK